MIKILKTLFVIGIFMLTPMVGSYTKEFAHNILYASQKNIALFWKL
jgi:hypothetical protein